MWTSRSTAYSGRSECAGYALEDVLDFGGDIFAREDGVELVVGCVGWHLPYPFFAAEL